MSCESSALKVLSAAVVNGALRLKHHSKNVLDNILKYTFYFAEQIRLDISSSLIIHLRCQDYFLAKVIVIKKEIKSGLLKL